MRHAPIGLGLVIVLSGCATAATPSPAATSAPSPTLRSFGDLPGGAPPATVRPGATPAPTAVVVEPGGDPWTGPAGSWPGRTLFTFPEKEVSDIVGVAADGTIYTQGSVSSFDYHIAVRAFQPDGTPVASWPDEGVTVRGFFSDAILGTDGAIYVAMTAPPTPGAPSPEARSTTLTAIDPDGSIRAGWPLVRPKTIYEHSVDLGTKHNLVARPAGGICFVEDIATSPTKPVKTELVCLGEDGKPAVGWSYRPKFRLGSSSSGAPPVFGPDGTLYAEAFEAGAGNSVTARILALDENAQPRAAWHPVEVVPTGQTTMIVGGGDTLLVLTKEYGAAPVLIAVDADTGAAVPGFDGNAAAILAPLGADAYPYYAERTPDSTIYLSIAFVVTAGPSIPAQIVAIASDGHPRAGWPFQPGSPFLFLSSAPDGTIWVGMSTASSGRERLAVLSVDGVMQPGWPVMGPYRFHDLAFDSHGHAYFVNRPSGEDWLQTIDGP